MWFVSLSLFWCEYLIFYPHLFRTQGIIQGTFYYKFTALQCCVANKKFLIQEINAKEFGIFLWYLLFFPEYIFNLTQKFNKHLPFLFEIRTISFTCFTHLLQFTNTHRIHQIPGMSGLRGSPLELLRLILIFFFFCQSNEEVNVS